MAADFAKAKAEAERILKERGIMNPPVDPALIARDMGVEVIYADFNDAVKEKISGFIRFNHNGATAPQIVINKAIGPRRMTFTIAHELGHFLLHKAYAESNAYQVMPRNNSYLIGDKPIEEQEADCFAANLLVPADMLRKYSRYGSIKNSGELAEVFAVSKDVILNRMRFLGI